METILFRETQRFRQPWLWILLVAIAVLFGWILVMRFLTGRLNGDYPVAPDLIFVLFSLVPFFVIILFWVMRLDTEISAKKIYIHFFPFLRREIPWEEVESAHIRRYNPIGEYGGWGIRLGLRSTAYCISGNTGLFLDMKSGRDLLIGTRKAEELKKVLESLGIREK